MTPSAQPDSSLPSHSLSLDPETGIRPIARWGAECARGWTYRPQAARSGATVIKRKPRKKSLRNGGGAS